MRLPQLTGSRLKTGTRLSAIEGHPGEEISLVVKRNGVIKEFHLTAEADLDGNGKIGIGPLMQKYQFWGALGTSFERFGMIVASIFQVLTGQAPLDVTGPVGLLKLSARWLRPVSLTCSG